MAQSALSRLRLRLPAIVRRKAAAGSRRLHLAAA